MTTVKLPTTLVEEAKQYAKILKRSVPKQIEYWCELGKKMEQNTSPIEQHIRTDIWKNQTQAMFLNGYDKKDSLYDTYE